MIVVLLLHSTFGIMLLWQKLLQNTTHHNCQTKKTELQHISRHFRTRRCELKYQRESDDVVAGPQSQAHLFMGSTFQTLTQRTYEAQPNFTAPFCANVWLRKRRSFKNPVRLSQDPNCWCSITLHSLLKINETRKNTTKRSNIHVESEWCCQLALIQNDSQPIPIANVVSVQNAEIPTMTSIGVLQIGHCLSSTKCLRWRWSKPIVSHLNRIYFWIPYL